MAKIRRQNLPPALLHHLLGQLSTLNSQPSTSSATAKWFKRFPQMTVCGEGDLVKTFLRAGQAAMGEEVQ
jgi:hypothetical protein